MFLEECLNSENVLKFYDKIKCTGNVLQLLMYNTNYYLTSYNNIGTIFIKQKFRCNKCFEQFIVILPKYLMENYIYFFNE